MTSMGPNAPAPGDSSFSSSYFSDFRGEDLKQCKAILEVMKKAFREGNGVDNIEKELEGVRKNLTQIKSENLSNRFNEILNYFEEDRKTRNSFGSGENDKYISLSLQSLTLAYENAESNEKRVKTNADRVKSLSCYYEFVPKDAFYIMTSRVNPVPIGTYFFTAEGENFLMFLNSEDGTSAFLVKPDPNGYNIHSLEKEEPHLAFCSDLSSPSALKNSRLQDVINVKNLTRMEMTFEYDQSLKKEFHFFEKISFNRAEELAIANPDKKIFYTTPVKGIWHVAKYVPERDRVYHWFLPSNATSEFLEKMIIDMCGDVVSSDDPNQWQDHLRETPQAPPPPFPKSPKA